MTTRGGMGGLLAILVAMAACSDQTKADDADPAAAASIAPAQASAGSAVSPSAGPAAPATAKTPAVTIEGFGVTIVSPDSGAAKAIRFGATQSDTIAAIAQVMGKPEQGTNNDCPSGPVQFATWSKGLSANFEGGKFVGWAGAVDQKTARGIGFGSSKADLVKAYHPNFEQTTLGYEFTVDGITGVLESEAADAAITDLWSGVSCVAR